MITEDSSQDNGFTESPKAAPLPADSDYGHHKDRGPGFTHHARDDCDARNVNPKKAYDNSMSSASDGLDAVLVKFEVPHDSRGYLVNGLPLKAALQQLIAEAERVARIDEVELAIPMAGKHMLRDGTIAETGALEGGQPNMVDVEILKARAKALRAQLKDAADGRGELV